MTLKKQGAIAFAWDFFGKMAMHGMGFVVSVVLARLLEPSDFGLVAIVMVITGIAGIFTDVGLGSALIQRRHVQSIHYSSVFYFNISIGVVLSVVTYSFAPYVAQFYENDALVPLTQVISLSFILGAFSAVQTTKLRKELNYVLLTKISFIASLSSGIVGICLALYGAGVWALVAQSLTQGIVYNILIWIFSHWKPKAEFSLKALMQLWAFGFRMFLSGLLESIFTKLDTIIIGKVFSPALLGYFNRAKSLDQMIIAYSSGSLMSVLFPVLSKVQRDLSRFQRIVLKSLGIIVFITFFLLGGLYLVSHELIILLYGEKWIPTIDLFKILVLSGFGYPVSALLVNVLSSRGNSKAFLRLEIYKKIIVVLNLSISFTWGIEGYLYGLFIVMILAVYLNIIFVSKEIQLPKWTLMKPIIIQMSLTIGIAFFIEWFNNDIEYGLFMMFIMKGIEYAVLYILINKLLQTQSYKYFMEEFNPVFIKILGKIKR